VNKTKAVLLLSILLVSSACSDPIKTSVAREMQSKAPSLTKFLIFRKVTPLMNSGLSLGAISKVLEHTPTGDLFVTDGSWSNRVYRFSGVGSYRDDVGVSDYMPGRNGKLLDFEITDTDIYLLTETSVMRIDMATQALVAAAQLPISALRLSKVDGHVCAITTQSGLICFDQALVQQDTFATREVNLLRRHVFASPMPMAASGDILLLAEFYDPSVLLFDLRRRSTMAVSFPGSSWDHVAFSEIWNDKDRGDFSEPDIRQIHETVRRMWKVLPLPDRKVLLLDRQRKPRRGDVLIFDPRSLTAERHDRGVATVQGPNGKQYNLLERIIGYSATHLIGDIPNNLMADAVASVWPEATKCKDAWQCLYFIEFAKH
jgi:hypothetical protein